MNGNTDVENFQMNEKKLKDLESKHIRLDERYKQLINVKEELISEIRNRYNLHNVSENDLIQKMREIIKSNMIKRKEIITENTLKIEKYEEEINQIIELLKNI